MFVHSSPALPDPQGLSPRRARSLRVNTPGHKYCIPFIVTALALAGDPASSSDAGQMRTLPPALLRAGNPRAASAAPGNSWSLSRGWAWGWRTGKGAAGGGPTPPGALGTCYLATQKATGRSPFGTPGKAFNFISRHVNIPECSTRDFVLHRTI